MPNFFVPLTPISIMAVESWTFFASRLKPFAAFGRSSAILSISVASVLISLSVISVVCMSSTPPDFGAVLAESSISLAACSKASFSCSVLVGILRSAFMWCILWLRSYIRS